MPRIAAIPGQTQLLPSEAHCTVNPLDCGPRKKGNWGRKGGTKPMRLGLTIHGPSPAVWLCPNWVRGRFSPGRGKWLLGGCWPPFVCESVPASF